MSISDEEELEIARRIANGEDVDLSKLDLLDPELASGLRKLGLLTKTMQMQPTVGFSWGHLGQLQLAGQGGFGEVYRAYDPTLDRTVALKLKRDSSNSVITSGRDFVAEAKRLARVRHPHVLAVHGASYHDGRAGLWADWIDGETLAARLQREGPIQGEQLLRVLHELAQALQAVHDAGLVHGDIKPSNVMLDRDQRVILMDFGAGFESSEEGAFMHAATPRYLAPEITAGGAATAAVDLYAFGVLAHLLATGEYPELNKSHADPTRPTKKRDVSLPGALRKLITRLQDADPKSRPSSRQLVAELQRIILAPQKRLRQWLLASVAIGLLSVTLATTIGLRREQVQRRLAESEREAATEAFRQAKQVNDFFSFRLSAGTPTNQSAGNALTFKQWVLDSASLIDRELADAPQARAILRSGFAASLSEQGELDSAKALGERAIEEMRSSFGDSANTADALITQGMTLHRMAKYPQAQALMEEALRILQALTPSIAVRNLRVSARTTLLRVANARGDYEAALRIGQENIVERGAIFGADSFRLAVDYNNLANTLGRLGRIAQAEDALARARSLLAKDPSKPVARLSALDEALCALHMVRAASESAVTLCQAAIKASEQTLGASHPQTLRQRTLLAAVLLHAGEIAKADSEASGTISAMRANHIPFAEALLTQALIRCAQQRWQETLTLTQESLALLSAQGVSVGITFDRLQILLLLAQHALHPTLQTLSAIQTRAQTILATAKDSAFHRAQLVSMVFLGQRLSQQLKDAEISRQLALSILKKDMDQASATRQWQNWTAGNSLSVR